MLVTTSSDALTATVFGGSFISADPPQTFAPEDFGGDEQLMISTAEQFSRKSVLPVQEQLDAQEEGLMPRLINEAGSLGFCGIDTNDQFGGLGLGKNLAARILEFLSLNASFSVTIGITSGISQVGLQLFGNDSQRSRYLPALAAGTQIGAYCLSEPNSGTDALSMTTRADLRGDRWVLNGTKMWISNAKWADQFLVMAKVGGEKITAFVVERDTPGVSVSREEHKLGLKGSSTARVLLEDASIPSENMIYEEGRGHIVAFNALNLGRFKLASMSIGPAREAMRLSSEYSRDRKQFGQPIANFGLIEQKFALMAARFYAAESMIYRTGALIDDAFAHYHARGDLAPVQQNMRAAEEFSIECSMCKAFSTEAESFIVDESLQVFGGYGFTEEFGIARIYRDTRVSRIYEGTNEINRYFIAERILRKLRDGKVHLPSSGDDFLSELVSRGYAHALKSTEHHQSELGALADLAILRYAEQSARLRASRDRGRFDDAVALFRNWAHGEAARAYQLLTGESVQIPATSRVDLSVLADRVHHADGPL